MKRSHIFSAAICAVFLVLAHGCSGEPSSEACGGADCDDGIACTVDSCDVTKQVCQHTPNSSLCAEPLACVLGAGCAPPPTDYGPSSLFDADDLAKVVAPELAPYFLTLEEIKQLDLEQLQHSPTEPSAKNDCGWLAKPCDEQVEVPSLPGQHHVDVYTGKFVSGAYVAPTAQAVVDFVGKKFPHFALEPTAGLVADWDELLARTYPVDLNHSYELIVPDDIDWDRAAHGVVAVTQHSSANPETTMPMQTRARQIAVKYRLPVLHVLDLISFQKLTCSDRVAFPDCPANPNGKSDPLGYNSGNDLIRLTIAVYPFADMAGVPTTEPDYQFLYATFAMYGYARAYMGSATFAKRMLESVYEHTRAAPAPADLASKIVTAGGSKDGGAVLYATDADDRIVAAHPGGFDILDIAGEGGFIERWHSDWERCGDEEDWVYIPGPSQAILPWLRVTSGGEAFRRYWDLFDIIPQYDSSFANGPDGKRDLFMVYRYSTHDLHYPLGGSQRFWWESPAFDQLSYRTLVSINHDHGGDYEPGQGEGEWMELGGWDLMLARTLEQREPVMVTMNRPELDDEANPKQIIISGTLSSSHGVEGARLFVAQSTDRNFSLTRGIELPDWSLELPFSRLGNEGLRNAGPRGPEGSHYGGFSWTYVATTPTTLKPVSVEAKIIADPWGENGDQVVYLYAFPPEGLAMSEDLERAGFFVRSEIGAAHIAPGKLGDSQLSYRVTVEYDPDRAKAIMVGAWDRDAQGRVTWDFSRYAIVNEQPATPPPCQ